jgi:AcrR family transcriptional regulator
MGIKERRLREKERRRTAILDAARRLIATHGVDGMTMNQVADLTELNKATLYSYFSSKDDLVDAVVYDGLLLLEKRFNARQRDAAPGLQDVLDLIRATFAFYREHPVYFHAMNHQERRGPTADRRTPFSVKGDEAAARIFGTIREVITRGQEDGSIRSEIDVDRFLILYFACTHGAMHTVLAKEDVYVDVLGLGAGEIERSACELLGYYLEGRERT